MEQNDKNKFYLYEDIIFLILRIVLFISLLIITFKNTDVWWILALAIGALLILVMFRRLDFFEISKVLRAGINYTIESKTETESSTTPEKISNDLKKIESKKVIKSNYPTDKL